MPGSGRHALSGLGGSAGSGGSRRARLGLRLTFEFDLRHFLAQALVRRLQRTPKCLRLHGLDVSIGKQNVDFVRAEGGILVGEDIVGVNRLGEERGRILNINDSFLN